MQKDRISLHRSKFPVQYSISTLLVLYSAVLLGCCHKLVTVPVETTGKIACSAIGATGKVAAETVKATGHVAGCAINNPEGAAAAATLVP